MSHHDGLIGGVVVDEDGRGIEGGGLQDLLFEGAVSSLQQRHPVDGSRWNHKACVRVAALPVHH